MIQCPNCGEQNPERFRFCGVCGNRLDAPAAARREMRKTVTVLFSDVSGSTALGASRDPESMRRLLSQRFASMRATLESHGGTVEKFIGDAVMAVFGVPTVHEDDALRAVRAAAAMREQIERLNAAGDGPAITLRTGINTGEVVTGDPSTGETLVTGDAVNMAARLEQAAAPGEVLLGTLTWELVRDAVTAMAVDPLTVKGKSEPIPAYRLERVLGASEGRTRQQDMPLVDREREMRTLRRAFEDVEADRRCHLVTILGVGGMGKTRLLNELAATTAAGAIVLRGRCLPYGEGITFWSLREIVISVANRVEETRDVDTALSALARTWVGDDRERVRSALARALGAEPGAVEPQEVFWAVRQFVAHVARDRPLICAFDDLHWAEPMLLDLIESVVDHSSDVPLLVVCAARPELLEIRPAWAGGKPNATTMLLEPLPDAAIEQLVSVLSSGAPLSDGARARIVEAADGLPLYVEELLRMLADGTDTTAAADSGALRAPPSLEAIVSARLERLDAADRTVLEQASVIGRSFERATLVNLLPDDRQADLDGRLELLVRRELIRREGGGGAGYRFRHHLVRDAAYAGLPKSERASLHQRVAEWLAKQGGDGLLELRGYHLAEAHRYLTDLRAPDADRDALARDAAAALAAAGRQAFARHDSAAGHALLGRAAGLLPEAAEERLRAELVLAEVLRQRGDLRGAATLLEDVRWRAVDASLSGIAARAEIFSLWIRGSVEPRGWVAAVDSLAGRLEPVLDSAADEEGLALLWGIRLDAAMARGDVAAAEQAAAAAIDHARQSGDAWQISRRARATLGEMAVVDAAPVTEALAACRALLDAGTGDRRLESQLLASIARLQAMAGDDAEAVESASRAIAAADELSLLYAGAFARQAAAFVARLGGRPEQALAAVAEGRESLERRGDFRAAVSLGLDEVELLLELGRADEARERLAAIGDPDAVDDPRLTAQLAGLSAILAGLEGSADEAERHAARAVSIAEGTGSPVWLARAEGHRSVALAELTRQDEARSALNHAIEALDPKQAPALAAHLRRVVEAAIATT